MPSIERKLTTILAADVVSFSKLMGDDEVSTLEALKSCRAIIESSVASHHGRIFGGAGDSVIAEFASPLEAMMCALEFQKLIGERNAHFSDRPMMEFRVGINIGEVVIDDDNLYGEGVNVAARVESLANSGSICISRKVYDEVKRKLDVLFVDGGMQQLKNIEDPVSIYHIEPVESSDTGISQTLTQMNGGAGSGRKPSAANGFKKPSIAVLPFDNMSADPEQGFFADGITEDIITGLSRFPNLIVIARNSTFTYKDKAVNVTRPRARRRIRRRGERAKGWKSRARNGAAGRRVERRAYLGGALRPGTQRYLRSAGRALPIDRRDDARPARGGGDGATEPQAARTHGCL
jgi:adenylate cyclase